MNDPSRATPRAGLKLRRVVHGDVVGVSLDKDKTCFIGHQQEEDEEEEEDRITCVLRDVLNVSASSVGQGSNPV
jgi:hypothetical protein